MVVKYSPDIDYLEILLSESVPNIQMPTSNEDISKFLAKVNKDQIVGYEIKALQNNIDTVFKRLGFSRKQKLAIALSAIRQKQRKSVKEFSTSISLSTNDYERIERAEHNISFDTLDVILNQFSNEEFLHQVFQR